MYAGFLLRNRNFVILLAGLGYSIGNNRWEIFKRHMPVYERRIKLNK
jgi:hypothetical protein